MPVADGAPVNVGFEQNARNNGHDANQVFAKDDPAELQELACNPALRSIASVADGKFRRRLVLDLSKLLKNFCGILKRAHLFAVAALESLDPAGIGLGRRHIFGLSFSNRPVGAPRIYARARL